MAVALVPIISGSISQGGQESKDTAEAGPGLGLAGGGASYGWGSGVGIGTKGAESSQTVMLSK